jgi:hypothetical protein
MILELLNANPWRFAAGDLVYIAGHKQQPAKVIAFECEYRIEP